MNACVLCPRFGDDLALARGHQLTATIFLAVLIITIPKKESAKKQEPKRINVS